MSTRIFRLPFEVAGAAFGDRVALTAFLATSAAAVLTPWVVATRGQAWSARAQAIVIGGVLTLPFILVMDRGNLIAFVVPAMLLWMTGVLEHRMPYVFVGVVWAAAIKPQFALLAVVLLTFREFLWFARSVVAVLAVLLLPFLLLGGDVVASVHRWGSALQKFSESRSMSSDYPGNVSFAHTTWWLSDHVGIGISMNTAIVASFVLCAMLLAVLAWRGMQLPRGVLAIAVLCIVSLVVPISSLYYLVFAIPAAAMAYRRGGLDGTTASTPLDIVFMFAVLLSLAPLLLVIGEIQLAPGSWVAVSATPLLSSASWFTFALLAAVTSVQGRRDA